MTSRIFRPTANLENFKIHLYFVCQPACPGCARCRAPEISHYKGNGGGFTKNLFRRQFTHCAMMIPFILHSLPCSSLFFSKVRISSKATIACNNCLLHHTKTCPARDIISYSCTISRVLVYFITCVLVYMCTRVLHELRDYSLGQMAFAVFRILCAC